MHRKIQNVKGRASFKDVRPFDKKIERETGLEPAASTLARSRSTN